MQKANARQNQQQDEDKRAELLEPGQDKAGGEQRHQQTALDPQPGQRLPEDLLPDGFGQQADRQQHSAPGGNHCSMCRGFHYLETPISCVRIVESNHTSNADSTDRECADGQDDAPGRSLAARGLHDRGEQDGDAGQDQKDDEGWRQGVGQRSLLDEQHARGDDGRQEERQVEDVDRVGGQRHVDQALGPRAGKQGRHIFREPEQARRAPP